jgi:hypothetical protein
MLQMWNNRLTVLRGDEDGNEGGGGGAAASSSSPAPTPAEISATSNAIVSGKVSAEEKAKLSAGLVKLLGKKLPSFWNMSRRPRGKLTFRDFFKGVKGYGRVGHTRTVSQTQHRTF